MARSGVSRAQENKRIRQEALREQLAAQGHEQHISELLEKIKDLDVEYDSVQVARLRAALENHRAMLDKYLPSLKAIEQTGDMDVRMTISWGGDG